MSIATKRGDDGTTSLMYGMRVPKTHVRVNAYGAVDEMTSALGMAKATCEDEAIVAEIDRIQADIILLMGELALDDSRQEKYIGDGKSIGDAHLQRIETVLEELETHLPRFTHFVHPGESLYSANMHMARAICRRAERDILLIRETGFQVRDLVLSYVNRLSDLCWLWAREDEIRIGLAKQKAEATS